MSSEEEALSLQGTILSSQRKFQKQEVLAMKLKLRPQQVEVWFQKLTARVGVELPNVEVKYKNLILEADCEIVHRKPLPTLRLIFC